jgi:hypothetical protein
LHAFVWFIAYYFQDISSSSSAHLQAHTKHTVHVLSDEKEFRKFSENFPKTFRKISEKFPKNFLMYWCHPLLAGWRLAAGGRHHIPHPPASSHHLR